METALAWLAEQQAAMEHLLAELVEISSHTPDVEGNTRAAERFLRALTTLGQGQLMGELIESERFGAHLVARTMKEGPHVLLVGHHDTVFPRTTFAGFREDGPLLRGPGVFDMKGGLTVIAFALGALAKAGLLKDIALRVVSVSDEEVGSPDSRRIVLAEARGASAALVFESGRAGDQIVTRRKGTGGITVVAHGKAAHAGNAHQAGANAIWALARFVDRAQALTDYPRGVTVNVGRFEGGIGKNTVPERAEARVDFRFTTRADGDATARAIQDAAAAAGASLANIRMDVQGGVQRVPLERTEAAAQLAAAYGAAQRATGLGDGECGLEGGGSDANTCAEAGVPAIDGLGPRGHGYHTSDEQIQRSSLIPKAAALIRYLMTR